MSHDSLKVKILEQENHRNGISGAPFNVFLIDDGESKKVAILFDEKYHCAVLDIEKLAAGDIAFGSNSYRGDNYEPILRKALPKEE